MTYNFDAERWYVNQRRLLDRRLSQGEIDEAQYDVELDALESRYEDMLRRLDGTYTLPDES